ncbi:MAG: endolytic transglycosylase MltG [Flavobacteriales bacterium]
MAGKRRKFLPWLFLLLGGGVLAGVVYGYRCYRWVYDPNVDFENEKAAYLYVPTGSDRASLMDSLEQSGYIEDMESFRWVAELKGFTDRVHPGKYRIEEGMSNNELVNILRGGLEETVEVTFNNIRTKEELAGKSTRKIEPDSADLLKALKDPRLAREYGFGPKTFLVMFLPNTYEFYWDVSIEGFLDRMKKEYGEFWTAKRSKKARAIGLSKVEVSILASIVEAEQSKVPEERPKIARLFLNRLQKGMKLESDPTLVYAIGDFSIRRVLDKDRDVDSPYNTYRYKGLPPGPIRLPSPISIKAVLNAPEHDHLYMCAKPDSSGLHNFTSSYSQHLENARKYQAWLDEQGVLR